MDAGTQTVSVVEELRVLKLAHFDLDAMQIQAKTNHNISTVNRILSFRDLIVKSKTPNIKRSHFYLGGKPKSVVLSDYSKSSR